ncbi:MAG TPA: phospholipase [Pelotomaculum sp.]|nr:phospholipase [Pelotomaculum sp.]
MLNITTMFSRLVSSTANYVCQKPIPLQVVRGASSTHVFHNEQGRKILLNDGFKKEAQLFNMFSRQLDGGVIWVDKGLKSVYHYYDPDSGTGMWLLPSAAEKCSVFFRRSHAMWRSKKHNLAMFLLGAALHLVQDLCVPHHAACKVFDGHQEFEGWVEIRKDNYKVESGGIYAISDKTEEWVADNARLSKKYFPLLAGHSPEYSHHAAKILLPRAQQTTAGFLKYFYDRI